MGMPQETIRKKRCERCGNVVDMKIIFTVRDRDMCLACCNRELHEWNMFVAEADKELSGNDGKIHASE